MAKYLLRSAHALTVLTSMPMRVGGEIVPLLTRPYISSIKNEKFMR